MAKEKTIKSKKGFSPDGDSSTYLVLKSKGLFWIGVRFTFYTGIFLFVVFSILSVNYPLWQNQIMLIQLAR